MKAVVTGVAGFIGSHLAERLLEEGYRVVGIDSLTDFYDLALKRANVERLASPGFSLVKGDINDVDLEPILEGATYVFHQAGQPGVRSSWGSEFGSYSRENIVATQRLLEACRHVRSLSRFVYASSSSIYGDAVTFPVSEDQNPRPISPYGVTKLAGEHLCTLYGENFAVPTTSLRYFTVYGPRQRPDMAFTRFARAFVTGEPIQIFGDGEQIRDFTYVDDIVTANQLAAASSDAAGKVYNVAGGSSVSVNEVLDMFRKLTHVRPLIDYVPAAVGDVRRTGGSTDQIREGLGWRPQTGLAEGLTQQFGWASSTFDPLEPILDAR